MGTTNHHTPYDENTHPANATEMNGPLSELDEAITNQGTAISALQAFDMHFMFSGQPGAGEVLLKIKARRQFTVPAGLSGSGLDADTVATAEAICSVQKNGIEFGTMTIAAAGTSATLAAASATSFAIHDILTVLAPASQDTTLADLFGAIVGVRS